MRDAIRTRDGRKVFMGIWNHYLGVNNVDNMSSAAEAKLRNTFYRGEKRRWDFEKYVRVHKDQHTILEGLVEYGYAGIDERSKVRLLCQGIKVDNLAHIKTQILASAQLRTDFDACVNLYQDFIKQTAAEWLRVTIRDWM